MKPECSKYQDNIAKFILGDQTGEERQAFETHLSTCPECRSERESYIRTLQLIRSVSDEPVPRHFFVYPEKPLSNPWLIFRQMKPGWRVSVAAVAGLFLLLGIAAISRLQIRSSPSGWVLSFGSGAIDTAAFKEEILRSAEERSLAAKAAWIQEMRAEMARARADLVRQQKTEFTDAGARMDSLFTGRLALAEGRMKNDAHQLAGDIYSAVTQQRAQDLAVINIRFDSLEANNDIKERQTDAILDTLVQAAALELR